MLEFRSIDDSCIEIYKKTSTANIRICTLEKDSNGSWYVNLGLGRIMLINDLKEVIDGLEKFT